MNIKLFDLISSVNFEYLVFGSDFVHHDLIFDFCNFDYDYTVLFDYLHRNGLSDCVVSRFKVFNDISSNGGDLCLWIKEWTV